MAGWSLCDVKVLFCLILSLQLLIFIDVHIWPVSIETKFRSSWWNQPNEPQIMSTDYSHVFLDPPSHTTSATQVDVALAYPHSRSIVPTYAAKTEQHVVYWCPRRLGTWGENVLHYWLSRALAFWTDMHFVLVYPTSANEKNIKIFNRLATPQRIRDALTQGLLDSCADWDALPRNVEHFLPRVSNKTSTTWIADTIVGKSSWEAAQLLKKLQAVKQQFLQALRKPRLQENDAHTFNWTSAAAHAEPSSILYLHEIFRHAVVHPDTTAALASLKAEHREQSQNDTLDMIVAQMGSDDVVIEYRCEDIITKNVHFAGFLTLEFYREALREMVNAYDVERSSTKTAYLLIGEGRSGEGQYECDRFVDVIEEPFRALLQEFGYVLKLITGGERWEHVCRIGIAPFVICPVSAMCTAASLGNIYARAVFHPTNNLVQNYWQGHGERTMGNIVQVSTHARTYIPCSRVVQLNLSPVHLARLVSGITKNTRDKNVDDAICDLTKFKFYLMPFDNPHPNIVPWVAFPKQLAGLPEHTTDPSEANIIITTEHFHGDVKISPAAWTAFYKRLHSKYRMMIESGIAQPDTWLALWPIWELTTILHQPMASLFNVENVSLIHHYHFRSNRLLYAFRDAYDISWPRRNLSTFLTPPEVRECKEYSHTLYFLGSAMNNYTNYHAREMWDYHDESIPPLQRRIAAVRTHIVKALAENEEAIAKGIVIKGITKPHTPGVNQNGFNTGIENSHFCLIPAGDDPDSYRFYESLARGCIPVVVAGGWVLPFEEILPWDQVVIKIEEDFDWRNIDGLLDRLYKNHLHEQVYDRDMCKWHQAAWRMFDLIRTKHWPRLLIRNLATKTLEKQIGCKSPGKVPLFE